MAGRRLVADLTFSSDDVAWTRRIRGASCTGLSPGRRAQRDVLRRERRMLYSTLKAIMRWCDDGSLASGFWLLFPPAPSMRSGGDGDRKRTMASFDNSPP